jgi:(p)ppGpp synthase/HD superfamily hydrolase
MSREDGPETSPLVAAATELADTRHARQLGRNGEPVIHHLRDVAALAMRIGTDCLGGSGGVRRRSSPEELYAAGCLHACLEDTNATYEEVVRAAGPRVAAWVAQVSRDKRLPGGQGQAAYERQLSRASLPARAVKLADLLADLRSLTGAKDEAWTLGHLDHVDKLLRLIRRGLEGCPQFQEAERLVRSWRERLT